MKEVVANRLKKVGQVIAIAGLSLGTAAPVWIAGNEMQSLVPVRSTPNTGAEGDFTPYICECGINASSEPWYGAKYKYFPKRLGYPPLSHYLKAASKIPRKEFFHQFPKQAVVGFSTKEGRWVKPRGL